jgi:hypothetical protein
MILGAITVGFDLERGQYWVDVDDCEKVTRYWRVKGIYRTPYGCTPRHVVAALADFLVEQNIGPSC